MTDPASPVIVAADGGGTGCRAAAGTLADGILAEASGGPGNVHSNFDEAIANLTTAVAEALARAGLSDVPLSQITAHFGVAGAHTAGETATVARALPYGRSHVTGDRATSVRGALGNADGYVVALGTGTIIARQHNLQMTSVNGWGFDLSDQASGAWLGQQLLRTAVEAEDGMRAHTALSRRALADKGGLIPAIHDCANASPGHYAKLAPAVIDAATTGDPIGLELMARGAAFVRRGLQTLGFQQGDLLVLCGGVGPHYARHLSADLTGNLAAPMGTALQGAFAMACAATV